LILHLSKIDKPFGNEQKGEFMMKGWAKFFNLIFAAVLIIGFIGVSAPVSAQAVKTEPAKSADVKELETAFKAVAEKAVPATVLIRSILPKPMMPGGGKEGFGSGAVISPDGYILTCAHVVDIAKKVVVVFPDGKEFPGKLLGRNKRQDFALLKIEATGLTHFKLGRSAGVRVGDWVIALGHPGGPYPDQKPAFAVGRVTGLHRKLPVQLFDRFYNDAIQTDIPIFAGNSGGPLIDLKGRLIGLNGAIMLINENSYAVPMDEIAAVMPDLKRGVQIAGKKPTRKDLQEFAQSIDPKDFQKLMSRVFKNFKKMFGKGDLAKMFKQFQDQFQSEEFRKQFKELSKMFGENEETKKLFENIAKMFKEGDMDKMLEDISKMFGGKDFQELFKGKDFQKMLEDFMGGKPFKPHAPPAKKRIKKPVVDRGGYLGILPAPDSDQRKLGGVLIEEVAPNGPAARGGVRSGDIILRVGKRSTPTAKRLQRAVLKLEPGKRVTFAVLRARILDTFMVQEEIELEVTIGKRE
jgi:serine protease Do